MLLIFFLFVSNIQKKRFFIFLNPNKENKIIEVFNILCPRFSIEKRGHGKSYRFL